MDFLDLLQFEVIEFDLNADDYSKMHYTNHVCQDITIILLTNT